MNSVADSSVSWAHFESIRQSIAFEPKVKTNPFCHTENMCLQLILVVDLLLCSLKFSCDKFPSKKLCFCENIIVLTLYNILGSKSNNPILKVCMEINFLLHLFEGLNYNISIANFNLVVLRRKVHFCCLYKVHI